MLDARRQEANAKRIPTVDDDNQDGGDSQNSPLNPTQGTPPLFVPTRVQKVRYGPEADIVLVGTGKLAFSYRRTDFQAVTPATYAKNAPARINGKHIASTQNPHLNSARWENL